MRRRVGLFAVAATVLAGSMIPAGADDTNTQFTIHAGNLAISVPVNADLGTVGTSATLLTGSLGPVTVDDTRGSLVAEWSATVSSTDFTTGSASASETVTNTNLAYSAGLPTASSGTGVFAPGVLVSLALPGVAGAWAGSGNNSVTWNPSITVTLTPGHVAGVYTATVTHSVA